jgi:hypothetical protein
MGGSGALGAEAAAARNASHATDDTARLAGANAKPGLAHQAAKYTLLAGTGLGAIWLVPQVMGDSCKKTANDMGLPEGSCPIISASACCSSCIVCLVMLMGMMSGGVHGGMF